MDPNQQKKFKKTTDFYDGLSGKYDRFNSAYLANTHERLLNKIEILPGERILDISCGTGLLAEKLLDRYPDIEIVLNDPSDGMRAKAEDRLKGASSVQFTSYPAEEIEFKNQSFDQVICLNSFHYYTDQPQVIRNIYQVLKPGGTLYILDWNLEGWFHLPNRIISLLSPENIDTRSLAETKSMLEENEFNIMFGQKWWFWFWKFYVVKAGKQQDF